jgi:glycosyltransferase involved in cell wall biosynthesis
MEYSVIIPLMNEEENIQELVEELEPVMARLEKPWELICVDDGSTDQTLKALLALREARPHLRIISFDRNYGQTSAFDAGFRTAQGQFVITMDGDRQNDPHDIPKLIELTPSYDLIVGWRAKRQDHWVKKLTSAIANFVRGRVCQDHMHDTGCSLKIYRRCALLQIPLFHGMHRFLPALFLIHGFKVAEVSVNHRKRTKGKTKYNFFNRSFNTIADMLAVRWMSKRVLKYQVKERA